MEKQKLLIADGNEEFCEALIAKLTDEFIIQTAKSGKEAVTLLDSFRPEALVVDVTLAGLDGIRVLEYALQNGHKMKALVTMSYRSDYIFAKLAQLDISYVLLKPCDMESAAERVREIAAETVSITVKSDEQKLAAILLQLGVNPKHNGYHYLCTAVKHYASDKAQLLTKELYVAVGAVYGVRWQQVERSIRAAVEYAWNRRNEQIWRQWFPAGSYLKRPTNGEVICGLAEHLRLEKVRKFG